MDKTISEEVVHHDVKHLITTCEDGGRQIEKAVSMVKAQR